MRSILSLPRLPADRGPASVGDSPALPSETDWALAWLSPEIFRACVRRLRAARGDVNAPINGVDGFAPLHEAIRKGHPASVARLLAAGADPNRAARLVSNHTVRPLDLALTWDTRYRCPDPWAPVRHECAVVRALLNAGARPRAVANAHDDPPLFRALEGCLGCALAVLEAGGFVARAGRHGEPVFRRAVLALHRFEQANSWGGPDTARVEHWEALAVQLGLLGADWTEKGRDGKSPEAWLRETILRPTWGRGAHLPPARLRSSAVWQRWQAWRRVAESAAGLDSVLPQETRPEVPARPRRRM